ERHVVLDARPQRTHVDAPRERRERRELPGAEPQHALAARMSRGALVVADGHLDERHQQIPPLVLLHRLHQLLEGLMGLEVLTLVEAPHAFGEAVRIRRHGLLAPLLHAAVEEVPVRRYWQAHFAWTHVGLPGMYSTRIS